MKIKVCSIIMGAVLLMQTAYSFADLALQSESSLFSEISAAYQSKFYPGAVSHAADFASKYPQSLLLPQVLAIEGESLYHLARLNEAESALKKSCALTAKNETPVPVTSYWLGRTLFDLKKYDESCAAFYDASSGAKETGSLKKIYSSSLLYAGKSYAAQKKYEESIPLLEYAAANGMQYNWSEYCGAVLLLFTSYKETKNYKKTVQMYANLSGLDGSAADNLALYAGDAENALGNYKSAYNLYESVLLNGSPAFAVQALQKSYAVSSEHQNEVKKDPGEVLALVKEKLSSSPDLLDEFYLRLGIDAFAAGNYSKSSSYLEQISENALSDIFLIQSLYKAELIVRTGKEALPARAAAAQKVLNAALQKNESVKDSNPSVYNSYGKALVRYAALQQHWNETLKNAQNVSLPDADSLYWKAAAEYETQQYAKSLATLETVVNVSGSLAWKSCKESRLLYAETLSKNGRTQDSIAVFSKLSDELQNAVPQSAAFAETVCINYASVLLAAGKNTEAAQQAARGTSSTALYLEALADFNRGKWKEAASLFTKYLAAGDADTSRQSFAKFYCGYVQYRSNDTSSAYKTLYEFAKQNPSNALTWNAYMTAASAAVANGKLPLAADSAECALKNAVSEDRRQKSVLLCAGIYVDSVLYEKALNLLTPYIKQRNAFGLQCRFETAQIYEKKQKITQADNVYASISADFPSAALAEEAEYRRGDLYYSAKNYGTAVSRFQSYINKYPDGRFSDAAMYFCAESLNVSGLPERAVLQYELLLKTASKTTYRYAALKSLCALYRAQGDYHAALESAKLMLSDYAEQSRADKIDRQIQELEQLASGTDARIVQKKSEYETSGGVSTASGRKAGTELAALYAKSPDTRNDALLLAEKLLTAQKKNLEAESLYAAENAALLASLYRMRKRNTESAKMYLSAAEYWRKNASENNAAAALYGAVEAFDAAGSYSDAKEAASLLEKLYPASRQNAAAEQIVNRN